MKKTVSLLLLFTVMTTFFCPDTEAKIDFYPDGTYMFASKDGEDLFMDVYYPPKTAERSVGGVRKPSVIFMFGGGFKDGVRDKDSYKPWFKEMNDHGYTVISIDYRQGLKNVGKMGLCQRNLLKQSIQMAVDDLFSATAFIAENAEDLRIDPGNIVISGSSAGAITVLQAEWEICNGMASAAVLPEGFRYKGVMAFAGAVYSDNGPVRYRAVPSPTAFFHGTSDKVVEYRGISFFKIHFSGSARLCKVFERGDYNYNIIRFDKRGHEIATSMYQNLKYELEFLENNVMFSRRRIVDVLTDDPTIPVSKYKDVNDIYKN